MRTRLSFLIAFLALMPAASIFAQTSSVSKLQLDFRSEINKEISKHPNGAFLYSHCDLYEKWMRRIVSHRLGLDLKDRGSEEVLSAATDESHDITNDVSDQNEASIAISRTDPNLIIAGANDDRMFSLSMPAYVSKDGGKTWHTYRLPPITTADYQAGGDPVLVADDNGTIYYIFLMYNGPYFLTPILSDIQIASTKDGLNWDLLTPVLSKTVPERELEDKESVTIDNYPSSPHYGRIYVSWSSYGLEDTLSFTEIVRQKIAWSDDKGHTWSQPDTIPGSLGHFSQLRVDKHGVLYLTSSIFFPDSNGTNYQNLAVSTDGGHTFQSRNISSFGLYPIGPSGRPTLKGDYGFRAYPYTSFDLDPRSGKLFLVYSSYDSNALAATLFATTSSNGGIDWSPPIQVGVPSTFSLDRFSPFVSFDSRAGHAWVCYYSSERDPTNVFSNFVRLNFDSLNSSALMGNAVQTKQYLLDSTLFDLLNCKRSSDGRCFIGDYVYADAYNGNYAAVWTRAAKNRSDADVFAFVEQPGANRVNPVRINAGEEQLRLTALSDFTHPGEVLLRAYSLHGGTVELTLLDEAGRTIYSSHVPLIGGEELPLTLSPSLQLPTGHYFARITSILDGEAYCKIVVL